MYLTITLTLLLMNMFLYCFWLTQVMALIAFLMEFKGNYGPHLIIVPNAVLVNWKVIHIYYSVPNFTIILSIYISNLACISE